MSMPQCSVLQQSMPNESSKETQKAMSSPASREEEDEDNEHNKKQNRKMKNKSHVGQQNQLLKNSLTASSTSVSANVSKSTMRFDLKSSDGSVGPNLTLPV